MNAHDTGQERLERIRLVARVQMAFDDVREAAGRNDGSPRGLAAAAEARRRLATLNRALAVTMVEPRCWPRVFPRRASGIARWVRVGPEQ